MTTARDVHEIMLLASSVRSCGVSELHSPLSKPLQPGIALAYAIGPTNPLVAALWGVFVWHEFKGAPRRANVLLGHV